MWIGLYREQKGGSTESGNMKLAGSEANLGYQISIFNGIAIKVRIFDVLKKMSKETT